MNNKIWVVRGAPGSGKSTYVKKHFPDIKNFEADMFFIDKSGNYNWSPSKIKDAHKWCQDETFKTLSNGEDVVVSNTFTKLWEMEKYFEMADVLEVEVKVLRMKNIYKNIHNVPEEKVQEMIARFEDFEGEEFVE